MTAYKAKVAGCERIGAPVPSLQYVEQIVRQIERILAIVEVGKLDDSRTAFVARHLDQIGAVTQPEGVVATLTQL